MYLGLDLALINAGWCILDADGKRYQSGVIHFKVKNKEGRKKMLMPEDQSIQRLLYIEEEIKKIITQYKVKYVALEGYAFNAKGCSAINLGELGGVIRCFLVKHGFKFYLFSPTQVKLFATGKGKCGKDLILLNVYKHFGEEFKTSDEADSFIVAKILFSYLKYKKGILKKKDFRPHEFKVIESLLSKER